MADEKKPNAFKNFCTADPFNNGMHLTGTLSIDRLITLGMRMAHVAGQRELKLAIGIFGADGHRIFQVSRSGTSPKNDMFLDRKRRTCAHFRMSTLGLRLYLQNFRDTLMGKYALSETEYTTFGGKQS